MINLYRDPKGEHIFTQGSTSYHTGEGILSGGKAKMEKLEKEVIELKHQLKEYEVYTDDNVRGLVINRIEPYV